MHQITVNELTIEVVRKKIKNLSLRIYPPHGRIRIAVPLRVNDDAIKKIVISRLPWIKRQQSKLLSQEPPLPHEYISGESHDFQGKRYRLNVIYQKQSGYVEIENDTHLNLYVREGSDINQRERVMSKWYRQCLEEQVTPLIEKWETIIGVKSTEWRIRKMKTKWGTCNIRDRRIWLSLELIKKPIHCLEYVIVHELVHLLERHHNERFKAYMDQFMPQWKLYKKELSNSAFAR